MTTGAAAFPYPDDDPAAIRGIGTALTGASRTLAGALDTVTGGRQTMADRWRGDAGPRAVAEVDAVSGLGQEAVSALADAQAPLDAYARALEDARETIDGLRSSYDDAQATYDEGLAALVDMPGGLRSAEQPSMLEARNQRFSELRADYDEVLATLRGAAMTAGGALTDIGGRISAAPASRNGDLARAQALDVLPFMARTDRTTVIRTGRHVILNTTGADDDVRIQVDPATGQVVVTVNGQVHRFPAGEADQFVLRTNGGRDVIEVDPSLQVGFTLLSGGDDDTVAGAAGDDVVHAGAGNDNVLTAQGNDAVDAGDGNDVVRDGGLLVAGLTAGPLNGRLIVRGEGGHDVVGGGRGNDVIRTLSGNDVADGGEGDDTLETGDGNDRVRGGEGDDTVHAGSGNDTVDGGGGTDTLHGEAGDDRLRGGDGGDTVHAGEGDDTVEGGEGDDTVHAGAGDDTVDAGDGDDYVDGFTGNDVIDGSGGADVIYAGDGDDEVDGGAGRDYIDGYHGNDRITGGSNADVVSGGEGNDILSGGTGNDAIYTGRGLDYVDDATGTNSVYHQGEDTVAVNGATRTVVVEVVDVPHQIEIEGSPEFQARIRADLETFASSPAGRQLLERLGDESDHGFRPDYEIVIREYDEQNGGASNEYGRTVVSLNPTFRLDDASDAGEGVAPPAVVHYHELVHAYHNVAGERVENGWFNSDSDWYLGPDADDVPGGVDADGDGRVTRDELDRDDDGDVDDDDLDLNGDGEVDRDGDGWIPNVERQTVGLPVDHDGDPDTPDVPAETVRDHPPALTENALRDEMGLPLRDDYAHAN